MTSATTTKAHNLQRLAALLPVPAFAVLAPGEMPPADLLAQAPAFLVRGCIEGEDLPQQSQAGQGVTLGPVPPGEISAALGQLFDDPRTRECVVQVYVEGPSGVLICLSAEQAVLEYAAPPRGVTGGRLAPYVAVFPNDLPRYAALTQHLPALFHAFGPCDVELITPEQPAFVQVRPLPRIPVYDEELLRAKMALQELDGDRWVQNEFCTDLLESPGIERALIILFCQAYAEIADVLGVTLERVTPEDFLKIGRQIFMRDRDITPRFPGNTQVVRAGQWLYREYARLAPCMRAGEATAGELMRMAIVLRTYADLLERLPAWLSRGPRARVLQLRQWCRERLLAGVAADPLPVAVPLSRRLQPLLAKDSRQLQWISFIPLDGAGIVVVPGDFTSSPRLRYTPGMAPPEQPCLLVTDELYPEIYRLFPYLTGIICAGGGLNSHLTLLAREAGMPLWIQVGEGMMQGE